MAPKRPLTRERILQAGLRLADDGGIESLTMRRLARHLGVEAMSLYNHVANKNDLVDGIVDLVMAEIELPSGTVQWDAAIRDYAISAHNALVRHPWAAPLVLAPSSVPAARSPRLESMEWLLKRLREAGFSAELTYSAYHTLDSHIFGFTMWQLSHMSAAANLRGDIEMADFARRFLRQMQDAGFTHLAEHIEQHLDAGSDGESEFEFGLDLLLDGLERARADSARDRP
jgi:AcrR family transcriptional regulator